MSAIDEAMTHAIKISPRKPHFVGYTMDTEEIFNGIVEMIEKEMGFGVRDFCMSSLHDEDYEYYFQIDSYEAHEHLSEEQYDKLTDYLGGDLDEYYDYSRDLIRMWIGIEDRHSWIHAQGRYESEYIDIQVGIPQ